MRRQTPESTGVYPNTTRPEDRAVCPTHPGAILKEAYIDSGATTVSALAQALGVSRKTVSAIINGRQGVSPEMSLLLGAVLNKSPEFWLNLQVNHDLWQAKHKQGVIDRLQNIAALL